MGGMDTRLIPVIIIAGIVIWSVFVVGIVIFMAGCARNWAKEKEATTRDRESV